MGMVGAIPDLPDYPEQFPATFTMGGFVEDRRGRGGGRVGHFDPRAAATILWGIGKDQRLGEARDAH